jgi:hypothetical protein
MNGVEIQTVAVTPPVPAETAPPLPFALPAPRPFQETEPAVMPYVPTEFDIPL